FRNRRARQSAQLADVLLELNRPVHGRVLRKHAGTRARRNFLRLRALQLPKDSEHVLRRSREQDLFAGYEERLQPGPLITDDRYAAGRRLEQPDARRIPIRAHVRPCNVQREALTVVEPAVSLGTEM